MKMNKKGFTLVELLAVIAILAILVVMAVPNVLSMFNGAKSSAFASQAESLYKAAQEQVISKQLTGASSSAYTFCSATAANNLNINASSNLHYYIKYSNGNITDFYVEDGSFAIKLTGTVQLESIPVVSGDTYSNIYLSNGTKITTCAATADIVKTESTHAPTK